MSSYIEKPRTTCSLGGALAVLSSMPGVIPISHTASGCAGNLSNATAFNSGYCGSSYCSGQNVPVSNIGEFQVIFGGGNRLKEEIESTFELLEGDLFVVTTGCMTEIIADDLYSVVKEFEDQGKPILYVNTPSFEGDAYAGYDLVLDGIFNNYLKPVKKKDPTLVNIFGVVPLLDPFFRGDLEEIKRLLEKLGLKVNTFFTSDQTFQNIKSAPKAALNIVLSRTHGVKLAKAFEKKHKTPYLIADIPVGAEQTDEFLKLVASKLDIEKKVVNKVINEENKVYYSYVERLADLICDSEFKFYYNVVSNSSTALPYAEFLEKELGWIPENIFISEALKKRDIAGIEEAFAQKKLRGQLTFEPHATQIQRKMTEAMVRSNGAFYQNTHTPVYVLGSTFEKSFIQKNASAGLYVSYPVYNRVVLDRGYAGYRGGLHLFEDIFSSLVAGR